MGGVVGAEGDARGDGDADLRPFEFEGYLQEAPELVDGELGVTAISSVRWRR